MLVSTVAMGAAVEAEGDAVVHVHVVNFEFQPTPARIFIGDTVFWDNHAGNDHTVSSHAGQPVAFNQLLNAGETFQLTFPNVVTVTYQCNIHNVMQGTIEVYDPDTLPDLAVAGVEVVSEVPGFSMDFQLTVTNEGNGPSAPVTARLDHHNGETVRRIGVFNVPVLAAGASYSDTIRWATVGKVGDFDLEAIVDFNDAVFEAEEANNFLPVVASVLVPGVPGFDAHDPPTPIKPPPSVLRRLWD